MPRGTQFAASRFVHITVQLHLETYRRRIPHDGAVRRCRRATGGARICAAMFAHRIPGCAMFLAMDGFARGDSDKDGDGFR